MPSIRAAASNQPSERRSPCPLACGLDIFGDKWTLLVVRDLLFSDHKRFKDFTAAPERIPTNLLSDRLTRLAAHGIIEQVAPPGGSRHLAYRLTAKGRALGPMLAAMRDWALAWVPGTEAFIGRDEGHAARAKITGKITPGPRANRQTAGAGAPTVRRRRASRPA